MFLNKPISRKQFFLTSILILSSLFSKVVPATVGDLKEQIICDYHQFYRVNNIAQRFFELGSTGLLANTDIDRHFRDYWQDHIRSNLTNNISTLLTDYGQVANYASAVPIYFISLCLTSSLLEPMTGLRLWANHSLRSILVGSPEQFFLSHLLGSGRPVTESSTWHFFKYHRAVSGHAFFGAIPLINLAKQLDGPMFKLGFYLLSVLPGLARINEDKHYLSQVILGWGLAYHAANAVWDSDKVSNKPQKKSFFLHPLNNGFYLGLKANF